MLDIDPSRRFLVLASLALPLIGGAAEAQSDLADDAPPVIVTDGSKDALRNLEVWRKQEALIAGGQLDAGLGFTAEDATNHGRAVGRAGFRRVLADIYTTFPDWKMQPHAIVAMQDLVIHRSTVSGTHLGIGKLPVNGGLLVGVQPTGKRFSCQHIHWNIFRDGLITGHWANRDDIKMMQDLGLLPASPPFR